MATSPGVPTRLKREQGSENFISDTTPQPSVEKDHSWIIAYLAYSTRISLSFYFNTYTNRTQSSSFDTSHQLTSFNYPAIRWDGIHYTSIAMDGYGYEQQLAFMPGWPVFMRLSGEVIRLIRIWVFNRGRTEKMGLVSLDIALGAVLLNQIAFTGAIVMLYKLTKAVTRSNSFAKATTVFYLFLPTPAIVEAPYTEPLCAFFTITAFYLSFRQRRFSAAALMALSTSLRSTGMFSVGILGWHMIFGAGLPTSRDLDPKRVLSRLALLLPLSLIVSSPFVLFQYYAYVSFCSDAATARPWCDSTIPLPYSFVQAKYWGVGFLKYWTPAQIPNYLVAFPVLYVSLSGTYTYFQSVRSSSSTNSLNPTSIHALLPFQIHHSFLTLLLILNSHTQIALRVAMTDPVVWWNVASMAFNWTSSVSSLKSSGIDGAKRVLSRRRMTWRGKIWVGWSVTWALISMVLWAGHYPPA